MSDIATNVMIRFAEIFHSSDDYSRIEYRCARCDMPTKSNFKCMKHFYGTHLKMAQPIPGWKRRQIWWSNYKAQHGRHLVDNRMNTSSNNNSFDRQSFTSNEEPPLWECHICRALVINEDEPKDAHMRFHDVDEEQFDSDSQDCHQWQPLSESDTSGPSERELDHQWDDSRIYDSYMPAERSQSWNPFSQQSDNNGMCCRFRTKKRANKKKGKAFMQMLKWKSSNKMK